MAESYNCLRLDNGYVFQVEVYKNENDNDDKKFFEIDGKKILLEELKVGQLANLIKHNGMFEGSDMLNLWQVDVDENMFNHNFTEEDIKNLGELGRKRPLTEEETTTGRRWAVNSALFQEESEWIYYAEPEGNESLLKMIKLREYVALYGARASGKSTRVQHIRKPLKDNGFVCIYVSFEHINIKTEESFWRTLGAAIKRDARRNINFKSASVFGSYSDLRINSSTDFLEIFEKDNWNNNVVLFIDEFDKLYDADEDVKSSCLETFRGMKNSKYNYAMYSIVAIVQFLYNEFANDFNFIIDPEIIEDIYRRTSGHAGLVCLCGRSIQNNLIKDINDEDKKLNFSIWSKFALSLLQVEILGYSTFNKMIDSLKKEDAKSAVGLLRSKFLGFLDYVQIYDEKERNLIQFLVAESALIRNEKTKNEFKMSSALVDELIRRRVIPEVYMTSPVDAIPKKDDDSLDILKILQNAVQFFDKDIITNAFGRSFKSSRELYVNGLKKKCVPRESVYDTELNRILVNWLVKRAGFEVTGQWHLIEDVEDAYSDIVITTKRQKIVLELLATTTRNELNEHFDRVLKYAKELSADDIWVVNFTCEDGYGVQKTKNRPHWPPDDNDRINVIHFFHDHLFEYVLMNARYVDSSNNNFKYIIDRTISLQS
ncbi:15691_t:CDS:2 [Rhizophagus irregularis]|nr:15691_t:CDS:2 [Rhizophagus irregularis]